MFDVFKKLSEEKKWVVGTFIFLVTVFSITALAMSSKTSVYSSGLLEKEFSSSLPAEYTSLSEKSSSNGLKAVVKGSIYEPGSNMTVFGACFDGDGYLLPDADAKFSAWYPNGTVLMANASMFKIYNDSTGFYPNGTGRWGIHVTMGDTVGTYLTELRCTYQGDWAISFGEWQNPEWVQRIKTIDDLSNDTNIIVHNVSNQIVDLKNVTENSFANVTDLLNVISSSGGVNYAQVRELRSLVQSVDLNMWVLDDKNPYYILGSGVHDWSAVDVLNENSVVAVSKESDFASWDGISWDNLNVNDNEGTPGKYEFRGVSQLAANVPYAWIVGTDTVNNVPVLSINGAAPTNPSFAVGGTAFNDIRLFQDPNNPSGDFFVYVLSDSGTFYKSEDSGNTWSTVGFVGGGSNGRISQIVENYDVNAQVDGYTVMIGQGNSVAVTDGSIVNNYAVSGNVKDVSLLYSDFGYVVVKDVYTDIYRFNGTNLTKEYTIEDPDIVPVGVSVLAKDDVWVATQDPSVFYHFDGRKWSYSRVGYSDAVSVIINLGGSNASVGLNDLDMQNSKLGYAVGSDGMILVFKNHYDSRFDDALSQLSAFSVRTNNSLFNISNRTVVLQSSIDELYNLSVIMNQSIQSSYDSLYGFLDQFNTTVNYKLDNVLQNVSYTQLYLDNTLFPLINDTFANTVLILQRLGILESKINQTIELQNQTLDIVNSTSSKVDVLVNKSNRIHAWVQH